MRIITSYGLVMLIILLAVGITCKAVIIHHNDVTIIIEKSEICNAHYAYGMNRIYIGWCSDWDVCDFKFVLTHELCHHYLHTRDEVLVNYCTFEVLKQVDYECYVERVAEEIKIFLDCLYNYLDTSIEYMCWENPYLHGMLLSLWNN